jgi:TfoX/Sxy family transcriptional regulator of competence genes
MAYDEMLDERISAETRPWRLARRKMFGGTCYLLRGNMMCGVLEDRLIVRVGAAEAGRLRGAPFVKPFDVTGRPMKGWLMVEAAGVRGAKLGPWLERARAFAETLEGKPKARGGKGRRSPASGTNPKPRIRMGRE